MSEDDELGTWNQQFSSVGFDELLAEIGSEPRKAVEQVRQWISEQLSWKPDLKHYQSSWGWAEGYEGQSEQDTPLCGVFLIPEPERERVAVSFKRSGIGLIHDAALSKSIRAEVRDGTCVRDIIWVECSLQTPADAESVCDLLEVLSD